MSTKDSIENPSQEKFRLLDDYSSKTFQLLLKNIFRKIWFHSENMLNASVGIRDS